MKKQIVIAMFFIASCGRHRSADTAQDFSDLTEKAARYAQQIDETFIEARCDRLTFWALHSAFGSAQNLAAFETSPGAWRRDGANTCYPSASKSEISFDALLGVLHHARVRRDAGAAQRLVDYGRAHAWVMGEGERDLVFIPQLAPLALGVAASFSFTESNGISAADLSGFRGNLLALSLYLKGQLSGRLTELEFKALSETYHSNPANPIFSAVYHRYTDGDQAETIATLRAMPEDAPRSVASWGWGSAPDAVTLETAVGIMRGL